jgi:hypothetical protein
VEVISPKASRLDYSPVLQLPDAVRPGMVHFMEVKAVYGMPTFDADVRVVLRGKRGTDIRVF